MRATRRRATPARWAGVMPSAASGESQPRKQPSLCRVLRGAVTRSAPRPVRAISCLAASPPLLPPQKLRLGGVCSGWISFFVLRLAVIGAGFDDKGDRSSFPVPHVFFSHTRSTRFILFAPAAVAANQGGLVLDPFRGRPSPRRRPQMLLLRFSSGPFCREDGLLQSVRCDVSPAEGRSP
ncbi:hypothetical protein BDY21DRAFT_131914 [Lineolata rhizophorae]|uniref:Uncharacterized protein n=1 Tax=Lineolata rhizophorae TaxID=578093 RepID=A0A6A6PBJ7_9PEZI|nr:hypothetical protein BDY21DRAFT_131914 [Lineolata rhizophorae]